MIRTIAMCITFSLLLQATAANASSLPRNLQFENRTAAEGLSAEFVTDIAQDGKGYLWMSTQVGLNRFDGYDIKIYEHETGKPSSLANNFARDLYVDRSGNLWVATDGGLNRYDYQTDSFTRNPLGLPDAQAELEVRSVVQDQRGTFWLGTVDQGLLAVASRSGQVRHFRAGTVEGNLPHNRIIQVLEDSQQRLWIGTDGGGLARWEPEQALFVRYRHNPQDPASLSSDEVRSIYEDAAGNLWVGTAAGGLNRFDETTGGFDRWENNPSVPHSLPRGQVLSILQDADGTLWVGTDNGLAEWREEKSTFVTYQQQPGDSKSLINNQINALVQDDSGVLWAGTNGGASSWNYLSDAFSYYQTGNGFLNSDVVTSVAEDSDGTLWIGTYHGGLTHLDPVTNQLRHFRQDPADARSLGDDRVMAIEIDHKGQVWVGTRGAGVSMLTPEGHFVTHASRTDLTAKDDAIADVHADPDGSLWVAVFDEGLDLIAPDGHITRFSHDPAEPSSISSNRVLSLHRDGAGTLWAGTERGGINRYDPDTRSFTRFALTAPDEPAATVWHIAESDDGALWLSTMDHGLLQWPAAHREAGRAEMRHFGSEHGLTPAIYSATPGIEGEIWASSSRGLYRLDPVIGTARRFDQKTGLRSSEFMPGASLRRHNGDMLFGSNRGLVAFIPTELQPNPRPPRVQLEASSRNNALARSGSGQRPASVQLGYADPFVAFAFTALDFVSPDKNRYRYRLHGFDKTWVDAGNFRRALYSTLPSGSYEFEVQGANNDGIWNAASARINVLVTPPPWRQWWAYLLYVLAAFILIAWIIGMQHRKRRAEVAARNKLERTVAERTRELGLRNRELEDLNQQLAEASVTDSLTGLRNRRYVDEFIEEEIAMVERRLIEGGNPPTGKTRGDSSQLIVFMMIDLDGFKAVNDTHGHHAGDEVLLHVRNLLLSCCRASDVIVRWGGDEFMIIGHPSTIEGARVLAEKVRSAIGNYNYPLDGGAYASISASIGVAPYPFAGRARDKFNWEQVSSIADRAAYLAKENGKDAWVSLHGDATFSVPDLERISTDLTGLVAEGKVIVASSVQGKVLLDQDPPARPNAAR